MNINQKTKLDNLGEDSLLIKKRNEADVNVRQRFSQMDRKQRLNFIKYYYTKPLIVGLIVLGFIFFILYHDVWNKHNITLRCAVMNQSFSTETTNHLSKSFTDYLKLDSKHNTATFTQYDTSVRTTVAEQKAGADANNSTLLRSLSDSIGAGQMDIIISDETTFHSFLMTRSYYCMESVFSKEEMEKLKDVLYVPQIKENNKNLAYGICMDKSPIYQSLFKKDKCTVQKPILAIFNNTKKKETTKQFVYFLFPNIFAHK